ncbi:MAG: hypothetical protein CMP10_19905 [Zetaproteobacteria bacterium]|nr:hypothetical protein [Pseudobdellovibrionaceae bacterium]
MASSTNGQLMPPIMGAAAFIMAEYCNLTYFEVVRAAIIPALISYLALIYITHLEASKLGLKGVPKEELPLIKPLLLGGIPFLVPLGFLLYQLMVMRRSPQLSAYYAICALMGVMVARELWFGQREKRSFISSIKNAGLLISDSLVAGAQSMIAIAVAVATAGIIVGIVTLGLGAVITDLIDILSGGMLVPLLLITAVASLILGMGLPTTANYIVMASLTVPVIVTLGGESGLVVPVIAAHMFCFYFGILADDTPPVALAAYAAAAISKADPFRTGVQGFLYDMRTAILPFIFIFNTDLLLIGIDGWASIVWVFVTALIAMFGFAALTQNWLIAKNRMYESLLLAAMSILLFRPDVGQMVFDGMSKLSVQIAALILLAVVLLSQKMRIVRSTSSELVEST